MKFIQPLCSIQLCDSQSTSLDEMMARSKRGRGFVDEDRGRDGPVETAG